MPPTGDDCEPTWSALGNGVLGGDYYPRVYASAAFDDGSGSGPSLYVGGDFATAGNVDASNIARWDGVGGGGPSAAARSQRCQVY